MQTLMKAWAQKAEADLETANRELHIDNRPNYDAVCFHAQQSALRYLKARLLKADIPFPSTSHLVVLLELCMNEEPGWEEFRPHLRSLNHLAAQLEDPECVPDGPMAAEAYSLARSFRDAAKASLALEPEAD
jgi:HEPN domain-containing protein